MRFSFIAPEPRPLISIFSKIWLSLISFVFVALLATNFFILYKKYSIEKNINFLSNEQKELSQKIVTTDEISAKLAVQIESANDILTSNSILKQSLHNLFDLIIRGITPTKDVFNQLLASPLRSIFTTSNTSFYQSKNGWYGFISTNKIDNSEGYNE